MCARHWQRSAADVDVDRIAVISRTTVTEGDVIDGRALRIRSAHESFANVAAFGAISVLDAFSAGRTVRIRLALESQTTAFVVWVADVAAAASAVERSLVVRAQSARTTRSVTAEVDGRALRVWIAAEAGLAVADGPMVFRGAQRLLAARLAHLAGQFADLLVAVFVRRTVDVVLALDAPAVALRVARETGFARAQGVVITSRALGVSAAEDASFAWIAAVRPAVRIGHTIFVGQTVVVAAASDLFRAYVILAELEVGAAGVPVARRLADALQTQLVADAVAARCADGTADARIANGARRTLVVDAAVLDGHAAEQRVAGSAGLARAHADVILDGAVGVVAARIGYGARIHAFGVETGFRVRAVVVLAAFDELAFDGRVAARV